MTSAFSGIRILDFTRRLPGAMAMMLFADFGADVVRVSAPADDAERAHPGYLCWDRNKRRVALDVGTYDGLAAARRLLARADVAVFDSRPGELERLGLDAVLSHRTVSSSLLARRWAHRKRCRRGRL
jgi:crotonobetainyl-CoA:carnitine CoA-transferase CaiB-like acyl-CoA transferase